MRIMGLDYGSKTVGVAMSDPLHITAQGTEIIRREKENHMRKTLARIDELIKEYEVGLIVLGYPLNMDDSRGPRALASEELARKLKSRTGLDVVLWDERLTTVEADEIMSEAHIHHKDRGINPERIDLEKITFAPEGEETIDFYILETTRLGGVDYILVTEEPEGDGQAYIMKDLSDPGDEEALYEMVEDDDELKAVGKVFESILEDVNIV